jgi:hypothetical protein
MRYANLPIALPVPHEQDFPGCRTIWILRIHLVAAADQIHHPAISMLLEFDSARSFNPAENWVILASRSFVGHTKHESDPASQLQRSYANFRLRDRMFGLLRTLLD